MKNPQTPIPNQFLNYFSSRMPGVWKKADYLRHMRGKLEEDWDKRVFMPLSAWRSIAKDILPQNSPESLAFAAMNLQVMGAWRPTQDILRFDPDFYRMLTRTEISGNLPVEIMERMPAWALYFEAQDLVVEGKRYDGFFASLDQSNGREQMLLRLHFIARENMSILPYLIPLGSWTLEQAVEMANEQQSMALAKMNMEMTAEYTRIPGKGAHEAMNLLLYVCSYGLDENRAQDLGGSMHYPQPVRIKHGNWRLFPPPKPVVHKMGMAIGEEERRFNVMTGASRPHGSPRPHIRRAHWHGYWQGPLNMQDKRKFSLKWLPPFMVGKAGGIPGNDDCVEAGKACQATC